MEYRAMWMERKNWINKSILCVYFIIMLQYGIYIEYLLLTVKLFGCEKYSAILGLVGRWQAWIEYMDCISTLFYFLKSFDYLCRRFIIKSKDNENASSSQFRAFELGNDLDFDRVHIYTISSHWKQRDGDIGFNNDTLYFVLNFIAMWTMHNVEQITNSDRRVR